LSKKHDPTRLDLLLTKISAPLNRSRIVSRARLTEHLRSGMYAKLTLIVAPAGYGKTTLLREWMTVIEPMHWPIAWVSLDADDNNYRQFWSYILGALEIIDPSLKQIDLLDILGQSCEEFDYQRFTPLINHISMISKNFTLVLDDYQVINSDEINRSIIHLLEYMPENMHLVISSRVTPPLPISRLRVRKQLVEIQPTDLAFTVGETDLFLTKVMEIVATQDETMSLNSLTEGWAAGLQLVALSIKGGRDIPSVLQAFARNNHFIVDYLTDEVLDQQDENIKDFLLKTSIFSRFTASLCDAVLEISNSAQILQLLEKSNILIVPLDERRQWYRYHALFADSLKLHLEQEYPAQIPQLHLKAYTWFEQNDFSELAIPQALAAGKHEKAADIVEVCALKAIIQFQLVTVMQWIDRLPTEIYATRPRLAILYALANIIPGRICETESRLEDVKGMLASLQLSEGEAAVLHRQLDAISATLACIQNNFTCASKFLDRASSTLTSTNASGEDIFLLGMVKHFAHYAFLSEGNLSEALAAVLYAVNNAQNHRYDREYIGSSMALARIYRHMGQLKDAAGVYEHLIDFARRKHLEEYVKYLARAGLAEIYREWNQVTKMEAAELDAWEYFSSSTPSFLEWYYSPDLSILLARNQLLYNNYEEVHRLLDAAVLKMGAYYPVPFLAGIITSVRVQAWLIAGDIDAAQTWGWEIQEQLNTSANSVGIFEQIELARVLLATHTPEKALTVLDLLPPNDPALRLTRNQIEIHLLQALSFQQVGDKAKARAALVEALHMARPGGYQRIFVDKLKPMQKLLTDTLTTLPSSLANDSSAILQVQIHDLLSCFETKVNPIKVSDDGLQIIEPLIEPLSERELQILKMLLQGMIPKEISAHLTISLNTARTHVKNIYAKLEVHTREEAIEKARRIGL